jgi:arsenate reductase
VDAETEVLEMKYVLFVCTHNAGRSQIAQALFERYAPDDVRAESAGSQPERRVWPEVVEVMNEIGIDLSDRKPKRLSVEMQLHADWAVTMGCGDACPYVPTLVDDWEIPDPAGRPINEVREIRDMIDERVRELAGHRIDAIRLDATAHRLRLEKLLPELIEEFGERHPPEVIRGCADRVLDDFDDVPVRSHILTLAHRRTRECLREQHCDILEAAVR